MHKLPFLESLRMNLFSSWFGLSGKFSPMQLVECIPFLCWLLVEGFSQFSALLRLFKYSKGSLNPHLNLPYLPSSLICPLCNSATFLWGTLVRWAALSFHLDNPRWSFCPKVNSLVPSVPNAESLFTAILILVFEQITRGFWQRDKSSEFCLSKYAWHASISIFQACCSNTWWVKLTDEVWPHRVCHSTKIYYPSKNTKH